MDALMTEFASCVMHALRMGPEHEVANVIKETINLLKLRISAGLASGFALAPGQAGPSSALFQVGGDVSPIGPGMVGYDEELDGRAAKRRRLLRCSVDECTDQPTHGWCLVKPIACKRHADAGMDEYEPKKRCNVIKDHQTISHCKKQPTYGWPGFRPVACRTHAEPGMEDVVSKRCNFVDATGTPCDKHPSFGHAGELRTRCRLHAETGMDLARQLCTTDGCDKRRRYGWAMKKPIKCRQHAETGMENVIPYERCLGADDDGDVCTKRPNFGWPGQKKRTHCKAHCQPGMEDLNNRKCGCPDGTMAGCKLRPKFGFPGEKATRCKTHAEAGMIDVGHAKCEIPGCSKRAQFGWPGPAAKPGRCKGHAEHGMFDLTKRVCAVEGCKGKVVTGPPKETSWRCEAHAERLSVRVLDLRATAGLQMGARGIPGL